LERWLVRHVVTKAAPRLPHRTPTTLVALRPPSRKYSPRSNKFMDLGSSSRQVLLRASADRGCIVGNPEVGFFADRWGENFRMRRDSGVESGRIVGKDSGRIRRNPGSIRVQSGTLS
jgi:hypothetical protein